MVTGHLLGGKASIERKFLVLVDNRCPCVTLLPIYLPKPSQRPTHTTMHGPTLLTIPVEVREAIYGFLFSSYTIRHGFGHDASTALGRDDASTRIALLLTNRQIFAEAWRHLPLNITLHFRGTENLLETLFSLDQRVIARLRHIRVCGYPFPLYVSGRAEHYPTYYAANALTLFPGLCLTTLVVEDCWHGFGLGDGWRDLTTYFDIEAWLKSDAWRELTYITPCTDFMTSGYDARRERLAQPEHWDALLKARDRGGGECDAEVAMYLVPCTQPLTAGTRRTESGKAMQAWKARPGHEVIDNQALATPEQEMKGEVRIVAKRAKRARAVQLGLTQKTSWNDLKGRQGGYMPEGMSLHLTQENLDTNMCLTLLQNGPLTATTWPMQWDGSTVDGVEECSLPEQHWVADYVPSCDL